MDTVEALNSAASLGYGIVLFLNRVRARCTAASNYARGRIHFCAEEGAKFAKPALPHKAQPNFIHLYIGKKVH